MEWTIAFGALLLLACYLGRPEPRILIAMWGNLLATGAISNLGLTPWPLLAVGTVDAVCAAFLIISASPRAKIIGALFGLMIPVYVCGNFLAWNPHTTYGIIDAIALLQLGAVGGMDRGIRNCRRAVDRLRHRSGHSVAHRTSSPLTKDNVS